MPKAIKQARNEASQSCNKHTSTVTTWATNNGNRSPNDMIHQLTHPSQVIIIMTSTPRSGPLSFPESLIQIMYAYMYVRMYMQYIYIYIYIHMLTHVLPRVARGGVSMTKMRKMNPKTCQNNQFLVIFSIFSGRPRIT